MFGNLQLGNTGNTFSTINSNPVPSTFDEFAYTDEDEVMSDVNTFNAPTSMNDKLTVSDNLHLKDSIIAEGIDVAWMFK